jgi:hypothetical protein
MFMTEDTPHVSKEEINLLFDAVSHEKKILEAEIFRQFYQKIAEEKLSAFLKDVRTCPPEVIVYCQELLAPKPDEDRVA